MAVINHRHGTTDWMPIDLRLRDDFEEAVALYKHYDLLLVNAMWDGMNLVSKEGPLVNTRDGMIVLSENTGAHEELGECALSVNPFDVQEQADAMHHALTASADERAAADGGAAADHHLPHAGRLDRPAARRHRGEARGARQCAGRRTAWRPASRSAEFAHGTGRLAGGRAAEPRTARRGRPAQWASRPRAAQDVAVRCAGAGTAPRGSLDSSVRCRRASQRGGRDASAWARRREPAGAAPLREAPASGALRRPPPRRGQAAAPARPRPRRRTADARRSPTGCVASSPPEILRGSPAMRSISTKRPRRPNSPPDRRQTACKALI